MTGRYGDLIDRKGEFVGVFGYIVRKEEYIPNIHYGLYALQHRGQDSAGMAINNNGYIDYHKGLGLSMKCWIRMC